MSSNDDSPQAPIPASLLDRYLAGEASAEERARVEQWRRTNPLYDGVTHALHTQTWVSVANADHVEQGWQQIRDRALTAPPSVTRAGTRRVKTLGVALAASIAIVIAVVLGRSPTTDAAADIVKFYKTTDGQRASLTLEDGSRVTLAPHTTLGVARGFGQRNRVVSLTGEAIFTVSNASGVPFLVQTGTVTTRVLGTTFDVRRYDTDLRTRVAVMSGKVALTNRTRSNITLVAGAVGDATDSTVAVVPQASAAQVMAWNDGMLVFHNAPATDVLAELTRWYGYEFRLTDSVLAKKNVTARFRIGSSSAALANLKLLLDVDLAFDGKIVTLRQRPPDRMTKREGRDALDVFNFSQIEAGR